MQKTKFKNSIILSIIFVILFDMFLILPTVQVNAATLIPTAEQKVEYKAVQINKVGETKQLIVEVWLKKIDLKGMDLRLQYNNELLTPSNLNTNEAITIGNGADKTNFEFLNGFEKYMEIAEHDDGNGELKMIYSIFGEDERDGTNEYFVKDTTKGEYISITNEAKIARMSFQLGEGELTKNDIALKPGSNSPKTGIKVTIDKQANDYQAETLFEFVLELASKDAYLSDITISRGTKDTPDYKKYDLDPTFVKETLTYKVEILEYIDTLDLTYTKNHEKSTVILKVPKRDTDGNLVYEADKTTIEYEEIAITDTGQTISKEITLNKLGEPDTIITLKVTAEDGVTKNDYVITIERPCGTIKGKIQLGNGLRESMETSFGVTTKYIADIKMYKEGEQNWDGIIPGTETLEAIELSNQELAKTESDDEGDFLLYVIPGDYDCLLERKGFLAQIYKKITINKNDVIDLGTKILLEGDADRSGVISLSDIIEIVNANGTVVGDPNYKEAYDFGQKGYTGLSDIISINTNYYQMITIQDY